MSQTDPLPTEYIRAVSQQHHRPKGTRNMDQQSHSLEVASLIRAEIAQLEVALDAHRRALAALEGTPESGNGHTAENGGTAESDDQPAKARSRQRRKREVSSDDVLGALERGEDQAASIAREFKAPLDTVRQRLRELESAGQATRTGERRSTRWHAGTA